MRNMIYRSEIEALALPQRFNVMAKAYLRASSVLCTKMIEQSESCNWPAASVILMLAAQAVELFLKGAIYSRNPKAKVQHHRIYDLIEEYESLFPGSEFEIDIPFKMTSEYYSKADVKKMQKLIPTPSMLYRYPVDKGGKEWGAAEAFIPMTFQPVLDKLEADIRRIERIIISTSNG